MDSAEISNGHSEPNRNSLCPRFQGRAGGTLFHRITVPFGFKRDKRHPSSVAESLGDATMGDNWTKWVTAQSGVTERVGSE